MNRQVKTSRDGFHMFQNNAIFFRNSQPKSSKEVKFTEGETWKVK